MARRHINILETTSILKLPVLDLLIVLADTCDTRRVKRIISILCDTANRDRRRHASKQICIFIIKLIHLIHADISRRQIDDIECNLIDTEACKALRHVREISADDADENDHGRHTDDDSKHRQKRTHFVAPDTLNRQLK